MRKCLFICLFVIVLALPQVRVAMADDLDIYDGNVNPSSSANVLFILDNSGSMKECPGTGNNSARQCDYFTKAKIFREAFLKVFADYADEVNVGLMAYVPITGGDAAGGRVLAPVGSPAEVLQEKLLYITGISADLRKELVVSTDLQQVVDDLRALYDPVDDYANYRNLNNIASDQPDVAYYVNKGYLADSYPFTNKSSSDSGSPLGEALAEAGLYFAGKDSGFQIFWSDHPYNATESAIYAGGQYNSPILDSCQKNYVVVLTDGYAEDDFTTVGGNSMGWPVNAFERNADNNTLFDDYSPLLVDRLDEGLSEESWDDVAAYLHNADLRDDISGTQNVETIVVTFDINPEGAYTGTKTQEFYKTRYQDALALMKETAKAGNGGLAGNYFEVFLNAPDEALPEAEYLQALQAVNQELTDKLTDTLSAVFENIVSEVDSVFATPTVARNPDNQIDSDNKAYMAFFKPTQNGRWIGNLKAYGLEDGILMDSRPSEATDVAGNIKDTARSFWDQDGADDGLVVHLGGVGEVLTHRSAPRNIYTYTGPLSLTHNDNQFAVGNPLLNPLLSPAAPLGDVEAGLLINKVRNGWQYVPEDGGPLPWFLGDIIHSQPRLEHFPDGDGSLCSNNNYIFVGANDGMLHAFCAEGGKEMWAFIPPAQLDKLGGLVSADGQHRYAVDGSPVIAELTVPGNTNKKKLLIVGEGRGGQHYFALDFWNNATKTNDPVDPKWGYQIYPDLFQNAAAVLGQSWAKPQFRLIRDKDDVTETTRIHEVFLLAGGYDPRYETASFPASWPLSPEIQGRAIYTVRASNGEPVGLNLNGGNWSAMQHSILEVAGFDAGDRGYMDRVYAGDLGGNLLAATYNATSDLWEKLHLLSLPATLDIRDSFGDPVLDDFGFPLAPVARGLKIMTRPEITLETDGECVYFGTGDREHPLNEDFTDAFYAVCHGWQKQIDPDTGLPKTDGNGHYLYEPVSPGDLVDVTDNLIQDSDSESDRAAIAAALKNGAGWYIRMENPGEKIVSSPKIIDGKIIFTTFAPNPESAEEVSGCVASFDLGISRIYALDYRTGGAVMNFDNRTGLSKTDRSLVIGESIAYEPVLISTGLTTKLLYGSGGKLIPRDISLQKFMRRYFWRQVK